MSVQSENILHFLVADSCSPSTLGAQLERLRFQMAPSTPDPFRARDDAESRILEQAELIRFLDTFRGVHEFRPTTVKGDGYRTLVKIQRGDPSHRNQGEIALEVLKAFQRWGIRSQERGLLAVYVSIRTIAPKICPDVPLDVDDALQMFRGGKAPRARTLAASAVADALLALNAQVQSWNKRGRIR